MDCILILHNIRSVYNVGSIFRTADGAGVSSLYLTGITPTPIDRFGRARPDFAKVSLGAERTVLWQYAPELIPTISNLKTNGYTIVAIEQDPQSVNLLKFAFRPGITKIALLL